MDKCEGCGAKCCKIIRIYQPPLSDDEVMWWGYHGVGIKYLETDEGILYQMDIPVICQQLDEDGKCKLYGSPLRPAMCIEFDCDNPKYGFEKED